MLAGTVPSEASRARAIAIAKATDGVKSVTDSLRIAPAKSATASAASDVKSTAKAAGRSINDGWIKSKIYAQFLTDWSVFESLRANRYPWMKVNSAPPVADAIKRLDRVVTQTRGEVNELLRNLPRE